ncbi:uncharacterized protein LOC119277024 [Triticum dicoccoides]|uniref:uncharacterized protein LOC119277024 n=1 Tax=Triticum dicoccoides TaxID=85692 RepID=UPI00188F37FA|nr:uncharacterized protein LOC119277024 [Triticum dicoccoides]
MSRAARRTRAPAASLRAVRKGTRCSSLFLLMEFKAPAPRWCPFLAVSPSGPPLPGTAMQCASTVQFGGVASRLPPTVAALSDLARSDCTRTFVPSPTGNLRYAPPLSKHAAKPGKMKCPSSVGLDALLLNFVVCWELRFIAHGVVGL